MNRKPLTHPALFAGWLLFAATLPAAAGEAPARQTTVRIDGTRWLIDGEVQQRRRQDGRRRGRSLPPLRRERRLLRADA